MTEASEAWVKVPRQYNAAADLLDRNVTAGRSDKPAFIDDANTLTYGALQKSASRFANALLASGVQPEQRVALIMLDTVSLLPAFLGAMRVGIVPIPMNTLLTTSQYRYMLRDSRAVVLVISKALLPEVQPILDDLPDLKHVIVCNQGAEKNSDYSDFDDLLAAASSEITTADTVADEVAFWLYSSGSTGDPKGVKHIHSSMVQTAKLFGEDVLGFNENDVVYSAAKLFFAYGLGNALSMPMSVGATTILFPGRPTPDAVLSIMAKHNPSLFFGVPTLYTALLANPSLGKGAGSKNLRLGISAGEALPKELGDRWLATTGVDIIDGIGSTELLHIFVSNRPGNVTYGASGVQVPGYQARIVDENDIDVGVGEIGELIIDGPSSGEGYWNQREKSQTTFRGRWTYTGDKYRREADGLYYYCGRTDDMFKVSGIWVSPFEVESALLSHDSVLEAAVVGLEDEDGLMKPKAFLIMNQGFELNDALESELKEHVKQVAGKWKYPRWLEARETFPKTATGKIQRFKLRKGEG